MAYINSMDEILEFAIARELEAYELYMYLAQRAANLDIRKTCEDFALEELEHKAKLELEVMKTGKVVAASKLIDFNISDYMGQTGEPLDMNYKELLVFAIKKEETSTKLYSDLANVIHNEESREMLRALADEENLHRLRFEVEYDAMKNK